MLRKVDRILDSSFIRELTVVCYASGVGRPSIDPEVFFRMLVVAYLYDIKSDRKLCEDVHHNFAYRWFCRLALADRVPDHSSFSRIRDRYGEDIFEALFPRIVEFCQKRGLVGSQRRVMTDATLIAADAALNSLVLKGPEQTDVAAKRQFLEIVCLNLRLDGANLVAQMRKPFDMLAEGLLVSYSRGDRI